MTPPLRLPPGAAPLWSRLSGLRILLDESCMRLRALAAVAEDVGDGVVQVQDGDMEVVRLIAASLSVELANLERLIERLRPLIDELAKR